MLESLLVENLGVIEYAEVDLGPGLVAITGETGAGKTLVTTALGLLLGARGSPDLIGPHGDLARVAAQLGGPNDQVLVRRELTVTGRNRVRIDREAVTLAELAERTAHEVEIFGQHLAATLIQPAAQLRILDSFGGIDDRELKDLRARYLACSAQLEDLRTRGSERLRRLEFVDFELGVLAEAKLEDPAEDERVQQQIEHLASMRDRRQFLSSIHDLLVSERGLVAELEEYVAQARSLVPEFAQRLDALVDEIDDIARDSRNALESEVEDPYALAELEERLGVLVAIKRRFGGSLPDALRIQAELESERAHLLGTSTSEDSLAEELSQLKSQVTQALSTLHNARQQCAASLIEKVSEVLGDVALGGAQFHIVFDDADGILPNFVFSANPGIAPMPLSKVASGGELSRLMLAIARVAGAATPTLVFDEIDAGIGGETGLRIAEVLSAMARDHQVVVVTHLAQIAAAADQHIVVTKTTKGGTVATMLNVVRDEARIAEIARMLSGHPESSRALEHARDLVARFTG